MAASIFARVLVGWDGSVSAAAGLRAGCTLTAFPSGTVTAVAVVPAFRHVESDGDRLLAARGARESLETAYERVLATIALHPDQQVSLRFVEDADVAAALDSYAAQRMIDLLIVGLHGREGVLHPRMGHIANHVVKSSRCPVLVIPEPRGRDVMSSDESSSPISALKGLFHPTRHHPVQV